MTGVGPPVLSTPLAGPGADCRAVAPMPDLFVAKVAASSIERLHFFGDVISRKANTSSLGGVAR
jgi:hypothetical protein